MAALMCLSMLLKSNTYDEFSHLNYGFKILRADPARVEMFDDSKMPFSAFNAVSLTIIEKLMALGSSGVDSSSNQQMRAHFLLLGGRGATIFFALLLGIIVFKWGKDLYGPVPALFSLMLYVFSPISFSL